MSLCKNEQRCTRLPLWYFKTRVNFSQSMSSSRCRRWPLRQSFLKNGFLRLHWDISWPIGCNGALINIDVRKRWQMRGHYDYWHVNHHADVCSTWTVNLGFQRLAQIGTLSKMLICFHCCQNEQGRMSLHWQKETRSKMQIDCNPNCSGKSWNSESAGDWSPVSFRSSTSTWLNCISPSKSP